MGLFLETAPRASAGPSGTFSGAGHGQAWPAPLAVLVVLFRLAPGRQVCRGVPCIRPAISEDTAMDTSAMDTARFLRTMSRTVASAHAFGAVSVRTGCVPAPCVPPFLGTPKTRLPVATTLATIALETSVCALTSALTTGRKPSPKPPRCDRAPLAKPYLPMGFGCGQGRATSSFLYLSRTPLPLRLVPVGCGLGLALCRCGAGG